MEKINRAEAILNICKAKLPLLEKEERESILLSWWGIDESDAEFANLTEDLKHEILINEEPPADCRNNRYDQLLLIDLLSGFKGVSNAFIAESMFMMNLGTFQVEGKVEVLEVCPCCQYRTLPARGEYYICGLCHWEDNGIEDDEAFSGPNHTTLSEARKNFLKDIEDLPTNKWIKA